jgi:hypothetical protein
MTKKELRKGQQQVAQSMQHIPKYSTDMTMREYGPVASTYTHI